MSIPADDSATVHLAVRALRAFGDLTREQAAIVLPFWRYYHDLSAEERTVVLYRFKPGNIHEAASGPGG